MRISPLRFLPRRPVSCLTNYRCWVPQDTEEQPWHHRPKRNLHCFRPAEGYDQPDLLGVLMLERLGKEIHLTPRQLRTMGRSDVESLIATYGNRLGACLLADMHFADPNITRSAMVRAGSSGLDRPSLLALVVSFCCLCWLWVSAACAACVLS